MGFTHTFDPAALLDFPFHFRRNFYDLQFCTVTICLGAQLFHHPHQVLIISGNEAATLVQSRLI